ncbi:MAG: PAS domain S-box protein [Actinobacteria bacterium]|uniref:histidine kinase n=1 Tax=freshwater metagenome TaxID=449393 RepID=A0A6J6DKH8_9ZZZZ|nr:PAS domain S-box protein [Actinomycetota bacterium]
MTLIGVEDEARERRIADAVRRLQLLDTPNEQAFDDLVMLASKVMHTPFAAIAVVDRHRLWLKATVGLVFDELSRELSVCEYAITTGDTLVVADLTATPPFDTSEVVTGPPFLRAYVAVPVRGPDGTTVGTISVGDTEPRVFSGEQISLLEALGRQVEQLFALRITINERSADRDEALQREARYRSVLQSLASGVLVHDRDGVIDDVNPSAEAILDASRDQLIGMSGLSVVAIHEDGTPFGVEDRPVAITLKYGIEVRDVVMGFSTGTGARTWLLVNSAPLWDAAGRSSGAVVTFADVTDLLTLNNQLQESLGELAKAAQERAALLSAVSHDIRAPLAAIRMMTEILEDRADAITDNQRSELIRRVRAEARRTEGVLADLVSADRVGTGLEAPRRKRIDLEQLIYARAREFDGANHSIRVGELSGDLTMWADGAQLERIVDNLISNAVTHTPTGTKIVIEAREFDGRIELAVDDDGPGVPESMRVRVFSAYVRGERASDRPGTGLGLFLVQQFAEFHGGTARCLMSERGGARFVVTLPRRPGQSSDDDTT